MLIKKKFMLFFMITFSMTSCTEETDGNTTIAIWLCDVQQDDYNFGMQINFDLWRDGKKIGYVTYGGKYIERKDSTYGETINYDPISDEFEIIGNIKPFSEWNECNIKFSSDTTKNWIFKYEGKNIPKNISFFYDTKNNIGDTLIFWDSVDNVKYYFKKNIMELH